MLFETKQLFSVLKCHAPKHVFSILVFCSSSKAIAIMVKNFVDECLNMVLKSHASELVALLIGTQLYISFINYNGPCLSVQNGTK